MSYAVFIDKDALDFVDALPDKSGRIVKENLKKLGENPYPGRGKGDKEKLAHGVSLFIDCILVEPSPLFTGSMRMRRW